MFGKRMSEKPAGAVVDSDTSRDGSQDGLDSVEGELTSVRLLTTVLALVLSIFLVSIITQTMLTPFTDSSAFIVLS